MRERYMTSTMSFISVALESVVGIVVVVVVQGGFGARGIIATRVRSSGCAASCAKSSR